jgi:vancomycin resistance protein YoaR
VGLALDVDATAATVLAVGDDVPALMRPFNWLGSLFSSTSVPVSTTVDVDTLEASVLGELAEKTDAPPAEPGLKADGAAMVVVPGREGLVVPINSVAEALIADAAQTNGGPVAVTVGPQPVQPSISDDDAAELAYFTTLSLRAPIEVRVDDSSAQIPPEAVAQWLVATPQDGALVLSVDTEAAVAGLNFLDPDLGKPEQPVSFQVVDGAVTFTGGSPGTMCCEPASTERILDALAAPDRLAVLDGEPRPLERGAEWAQSLGITVPIGTFTTNYPAGQDRAINIVRIAEILRGTVIEPGETFSVNGTTGPRGREQGFVEGGIIINGKLSTGVGGGISQYATTLFNAAFFAGLDIPDYMMHTLYISRYPYGREATLAYNSVDLKITNNTPFGVLLWSESTPESITVTLYSTPWVTGEQTGQSTSPRGACTRVATERTRTWLTDGRTETDTFFATYQPREGVLC